MQTQTQKCTCCKKLLPIEVFENKKQCISCRAKQNAYKAKKCLDPIKCEKNKEYAKEYSATKRLDPAQCKKEANYIRQKRQDPDFRQKKLDYKMKYCEKNNITFDELNKLIFHS